uniref:ATP synthase F0 subunit 8 n=1 Tax=Pheidole oxyops TaxID=615297 RepID=A0A343YVN2_9HYME|nr:ATP synthase F0 subunit 8 [Pheidole oxyops]
MPQMMPLWWTLMIWITMSMFLITIIFIHFLSIPKLTTSTSSTPMIQHSSWTWTWY